MDNMFFHPGNFLRSCCHKGLQFLKPNFKNHPLVYVFVVVFFFLGYVPASYAAVYECQNLSGGPSGYGDSKENACRNMLSNATNLEGQRGSYFYQAPITWHSMGNPVGSFTVFYNIDRYHQDFPGSVDTVQSSLSAYISPSATADCPTGLELDDQGQCVDPSSNFECPDAGTRLSSAAGQPVAGVPDFGYTYKYQDCGIRPVTRTVDCYVETEGLPTCHVIDHFEWTGEEPLEGAEDWETGGDTPTGEAGQTFGEPPGEKLEDGSNARPTTTEKTSLPETKEIMPDGTIVTQETDIVVVNKGGGTDIETTDTTKTIVRDNGITKTETSTITKTTNPDGSFNIETVYNTTYEQTDKEVIIVTNEDGSISIVNNPGYSGGTTKTKTESYDADGKKTGETTTEEQTGKEEESEGFCAENADHPDCKKRDPAPKDGLYEPDETSLEEVFEGFESKLNKSDIGKALGGFYQVGVGSSSCPTYHVSTWIFDITFDQHCTTTMRNALEMAGWVILALASFVSFRIAFL